VSKVNVPYSYNHRHWDIEDFSHPANIIVKFEEPNYVQADPIGVILGSHDEVILEVYSENAKPRKKGKLGY